MLSSRLETLVLAAVDYPASIGVIWRAVQVHHADIVRVMGRVRFEALLAVMARRVVETDLVASIKTFAIGEGMGSAPLTTALDAALRRARWGERSRDMVYDWLNDQAGRLGF